MPCGRPPVGKSVCGVPAWAYSRGVRSMGRDGNDVRAVSPRRRRRRRRNRRCNRRFGDETAVFGDVTAATSGTSRGFRERSERPQFEAIVQLAAGGKKSGSHDFQAKFTTKTINPRQTITTGNDSLKNKVGSILCFSMKSLKSSLSKIKFDHELKF